jgi:hypothetical protein
LSARARGVNVPCMSEHRRSALGSITQSDACFWSAHTRHIQQSVSIVGPTDGTPCLYINIGSFSSCSSGSSHLNAGLNKNREGRFPVRSPHFYYPSTPRPAVYVACTRLRSLPESAQNRLGGAGSSKPTFSEYQPLQLHSDRHRLQTPRLKCDGVTLVKLNLLNFKL